VLDRIVFARFYLTPSGARPCLPAAASASTAKTGRRNRAIAYRDLGDRRKSDYQPQLLAA